MSEEKYSNNTVQPASASALFYHTKGLSVTPLSEMWPASRVEREAWARGPTTEEVKHHWETHPEDGVQVTLPADAIAIVVKREKFREVVGQLNAPPKLIIDDPGGGAWTFFRATPDACRALAEHSAALSGAHFQVYVAVVSLPMGKVLVDVITTMADLGELDGEDIERLVSLQPEVANLMPEEVPIVEATDKKETPAYDPTDGNHPLVKRSIQGMAEQIAASIIAAVFVLFGIAERGQATVLFAPPNTGKTLLMLHLLIRSIKAKLIDPSHVFYINVDDTVRGLVDKIRLAAEFGFHPLAEGYRGFTAGDLLPLLKEIIARGDAPKSIIILDTLKRFANTMDKGASSRFTAAVREFVMAGGTIVALAHTNKNRTQSGKVIPAGTSDILDDFDCGYILDQLPGGSDANCRVVEFTNIKRRDGNVVSSVAFSFTLDRGITYDELLASIEEVDPETLAIVRQAAELDSDGVVIEAVRTIIGESAMGKMQLSEEAAARARVSQRTAIRVIEKYAGTDPAVHRWTYTVQARGAKVFKLLDPASEVVSEA